MLQNEVYIGNMVQGKRKVVSFKTKKCVGVDPDRWIVVRGTHERIIDEETWNRVQKRIENKQHRIHRTNKEKLVALFSGMLKCADCGANMSFTPKRTEENIIGYYRCGRYVNNGKETCTTHCIKEASLTAFVLNDIRYHARLAKTERELLARELSDAMNQNGREESKRIQSSLKETDSRLAAIEKNIKNLYEDKCADKIPETIFSSLLTGYMSEQETLTAKRRELIIEYDSYQQAENIIDRWLSIVGQYTEITTLERSTVVELIDTITIGDCVTSEDDAVQEIIINYRFIGTLLKDEKKDIA